MKQTNLYLIGTIIRKYCMDTSSFYEGEITSFDAVNNLYHVKYIQGDRGEFTYSKIRKHRKTAQKYTKQKQPKPISHGPKR